jgi:hypothetical protein
MGAKSITIVRAVTAHIVPSAISGMKTEHPRLTYITIYAESSMSY